LLLFCAVGPCGYFPAVFFADEPVPTL